MKPLHLAKVTGATLVIAKLDRLSRNAAFLLALRDSGARFVAVDMPEANDLTVGIMALVAQAKREAISRRTKEALAVAKARGVKLGNPNGAESLRRAGKGGVALRAAVSANAAAFAQDLLPVLADIRTAGHTSLRSIAAELTARGIRTRRGGRWNVGNVVQLLLRNRPYSFRPRAVSRLKFAAEVTHLESNHSNWLPRIFATMQDLVSFSVRTGQTDETVATVLPSSRHSGRPPSMRRAWMPNRRSAETAW